MRRAISVELGTRCFSLSVGTKELSNTEANATELELKEGASMTIVRPSPTEEQRQEWQKLKEKSTDGEVEFDKERIKKIGWACIEDALIESRFDTVNFVGCGIGVDEAEIIGEAVAANESLENLMLSRNELGDDGAVVLMQALKNNKNLTNIYLRNNNINDDGAIAIAEAVQTNKNLQSINLANNHISDIGAASIADALKINKKLDCIDFNDNKIKDDGAIAIAEALGENTSLEILVISNNQFGDVGKETLKQAQAARQKRGKRITIVWSGTIR